jgi:putative peptidoglycan lipid II flippase
MVSFSDPGVRQIMRLMAPAIIGSAALQVNLVVITNFATSLGSGSVSWLAYAFRMIYLPLGIFGVAISTATLPVASRAATLDNLDEFRRTITSSMRLTLLLTIPSAIGLMVLSRPIIALIYQRASFSSFDTNQTALALRFFAIGLVAYSAVRLLAPSFYALGDARTPMIASLFSILTNFVVATLTVDYLGMGHSGLALSISMVAIINFLVLFFFMRRKLGHLEGRELASTFLKVLAASLVMGALSWMTSYEIENRFGTEQFLLRLIDVGVSISVGLIVFYLLARLLHVSELDQITGALRRKLVNRKQ